ncbi:MAG TPA: apolipoprotein N-acyltransferase [Caulobacteraceae bacterium]|nr:apolipoprotein N-acyltransferase [Caulobacteraceae bacterium]
MSWPSVSWTTRLINYAVMLAAGALMAFAFPPFGFWPGLIGYPLLFWAIDRVEGPGRLWRAFGYGWLAGFAFFLVGCWWVAEAFFVDARQAWMAPFAAALLPAGIGLFWGAACALYRKLAPAHVGRVFVFAAVFGLFEWLRGHVLTGFPWNLLGETWRAGSAPSEMAAFVGAYGLTTLTLVALFAFGPLLGAGNRKYRAGIAAVGTILLACMWIAGAIRLDGAHVHPTPTVVRVVQPDVPQESKWSKEALAGIVRRYVNLTSHMGDKDPDVVIWPEGALPMSAQDTLDPEGWVEPAIAQALEPNQTLLIGTYRAEQKPHDKERYYNSLMAVHRAPGGALQVVAVYDKHRLVPFGEYLPLEAILTPLGFKDLTHIGDSFSSGPRPRPLRIAGLPLAQPLICYESLYPGLAEDGGTRPGWIINVSNDAWFGPTSGPLQHLNLASYRAIEQGLPLVRATPTGVSAVIDPWGRVLPGARLNPGESGVIDQNLPQPASPTLYSEIGDLIFWLLTVAGCAFALKRSWFTQKKDEAEAVSP